MKVRYRAKIKDIAELEKIINKYKETGSRIVFTNGCFDLLHVGHSRYLYQAKKLGDILVVAVNSDSSVRKLKGADRPIIAEKERLELVSALEMVDYVVCFDELTCKKTLSLLKPDIYVKGGDYTQETLPEWPVVQEYGGRVKLVDEIKGFSTTELIEKIAGGRR